MKHNDEQQQLSIGWHLSVVGQIYEQTMWNQDMLNRFAKDIESGALVNRAQVKRIQEVQLAEADLRHMQ